MMSTGSGAPSMAFARTEVCSSMKESPSQNVTLKGVSVFCFTEVFTASM